MDEQFIRDTSRKYSGTVIGVRLDTKDEVIPLSVSDVIPVVNGAVVLGTGIREGKRFEVQTHLKSVEFLSMPKSQVFDYKGITYVFTHKTERQWSRGICNSNSAISSPLDHLFSYAATKEIIPAPRYEGAMSLEVLSHLLTGKPVSLSEALSDLDNGVCISRCVTKHCFVSLSLEDNLYLLWWMGRIIAKFNPQQQTAWVIAPLFKQEVFDFFHRQGHYYGIE